MAKEKSTALYIADMQDLLPYDAERNGQSSPLSWGKFRTPAPLASKLGGGARARHDLYSMRRSAIKARRDGLACLGIYDEILIYYGLARRSALRGWLVNHLYQAAKTAEIAAVIGCRDMRLMARALKALEAEGLLIRVGLLDLAAADKRDLTTYPAEIYQQSQEQQTTDDTDDTGNSDDTSNRGQHAGQDEDMFAPLTTDDPDDGHQAQGEESADAEGGSDNRNHSGTQPGDVRHETRDGQTPDDQTAKTPQAAPAAPSPLSADGYGNETQETPASAAPSPADGPGGPDATPADATGTGDAPQASNATPAPRPPKAEPHKPTEADRGQSQLRDMTWHAESFAAQIRDALYPTRNDLIEQGRKCTPPQTADEFRARETACIAACFERALAGLDDMGAVQLLERALKEAKATHRKKPRKTRGRLWVYWLTRHVKAADRAGTGPPGGVGVCG